MRVVELWRFPVKSLGGERLPAADVGPEGLAGDRQWALFDTDSGFAPTAGGVPALLFPPARRGPDGGGGGVLPAGPVPADDDVLSPWLGRPVALRAAGEATGIRRY